MNSEEQHRVADYAKTKGEVVLRPHEYDGIQEFDQKMPNWWLFICYGSVVFFVGFWFCYYQLGLMSPDTVRVEQQMRKVEKRKAADMQKMLATLNDDVLVNKFAADDEIVARGRETYMTNCTSCHGLDLTASMDLGGGKTAPMTGLSLVDGKWKYGDKPMDIFKIINEGTPPDLPGHNDARMEAWGQKMAPAQIVELVAFVIRNNPAEFPVAGK